MTEKNNKVESITALIHADTCTLCETCLEHVSSLLDVWIAALNTVAEGHDAMFSVGSDDMNEFFAAQESCPTNAVEEFG